MTIDDPWHDDVRDPPKRMSIVAPTPAGEPGAVPTPGWTRLRAVMEGLVVVLRGAVNATTARRLDDALRPQWERRRRELEARLLRVETARRELEAKQEGLAVEWERVFAELDRVRDGWTLLGRDFPPMLGPEDLNLPDLGERILFLEQLWDRLMLGDGAEQREQALVGRVWERLVAGLADALDEGRTAGFIERDWDALARRLRDLERRWSLHCKAKRMMLAEQDILRAHQRMHEAEVRLLSLVEQARRGAPKDGASEGAAEEIAALHQALDAQRQETAAAMEQARAWKEEAEGLAHLRDAARAEAESAGTKCGALAAAVRAGEAEAAGLRAEALKHAQALVAIRQEADEWRARSEALEGRQADAQLRARALDGMAQGRIELSADLASARRALRDAQAEIGRLETRLSESSALLTAAKLDHERLMAEAADARLAAEESQRRARGALEAVRRESEGEQGALKGRIAALEDGLRGAQQGLAKALAEHDASLQNIESLRARCEFLEAESARQASAAADACREGRALSEELAAAACERDAQRRLAEERRAGLETLEAESARLRAGLNALQAETETLREARKTLLDALRQTDRELAAAEAKAREAQSAQPDDGAEPPAPPAPPPLPPAEPVEAETLPPLQPVLEPGWEKILAALDRILASAGARLRRLAGAPSDAARREGARQAAGDVAQARDVVTLVAEFMGDGMDDCPGGRVEAALEEALSAWEPALRARGISLVRRLDAKFAAQCPRPEALRVAFYQVVRNAYEAMPSGGCLSVTASSEPASGAVSVSFSDTGQGFLKKALASAFVPFVTAKPGHLGLGLAMARRAVRRMGGDAEVADGPSGGAVVVFRLPGNGSGPSTD